MAQALEVTGDDMVEMMAVLDADGDGEVTKQEFKEWYQVHVSVKGAKLSDEEFEKVWKKIDEDGDGKLQQSELCKYFKISFDKSKQEHVRRKSMTDMDTLEALTLQTQLLEAKKQMLEAEAERKKKSLTKRSASGAREGVTIIKKTDTTVRPRPCDPLAQALSQAAPTMGLSLNRRGASRPCTGRGQVPRGVRPGHAGGPGSRRGFH
jgi:Ca2+-binding EF-hand superfamily protein